MRTPALLLGLSLLLASCAPTATTATEQPQGPLVEGETWTITGLDQNNDKMEGRVVVPADPRYDRTDRDWTYYSRTARIYFTESTGEFQVWDTSNPERFLICIVRSPAETYTATKKQYSGLSVAGSMADLNAVFAKLSGSGTKLTGGSCTITR
ncbi:hypothetical protein [Deinococcus actinosclerus]|uniref:Lipoprotein n=1 Tax=Deinococcus actinosclerus TaxID=1768108 RepID=A0ABM5X238_9DEIO|nr:hypothetical protein [Deinococcus actinosclerus]ALW87740.1 hypothetical protein AUC44_01540 [Deinococcus actinosclerus]